ALKAEARSWSGLEGLALAKEATSGQSSQWNPKPWVWNDGHDELKPEDARYHLVCVDYGVKRNILRLFTGLGCKVTVIPAQKWAEDSCALKPDGVFLSSGPGDPAATGEYAVREVHDIIKADLQTCGICLRHQILGLALGASTEKVHQGHHGANHPVK